MTVQIRYVRTLLNWWNLYPVSNDPTPPFPVNVSPAKMLELFPEISQRAKFGCGEITLAQAEELFGGDSRKESRIA